MDGDPVTRQLRSSAVQLDDARRNLEDEQARLEKLREGFDEEHLHDESEDESLGELSHFQQHSGDVGTETFEREKDFSILEQIEAELGDVERALRRLDDGTYGECEACHEPIGDARLEAQPAARFCLLHQGQAESELAT
jgi:RNA polymerase-binding transcription factor DksA